MVQNRGITAFYDPDATPSTEGRPLPKRDDAAPLHPAHERNPKRSGLDWDAITPRCKLCDQRSSQLNLDSHCPSCAAVLKDPTFVELHRDAERAIQQAAEVARQPAHTAPAPAACPRRVRAKVTSPTPCDVIITVHSSDPIPTPLVAAILNDLLTGLQTSGVVAEPMERQSTVSTPPEEHVAPAPGKGKPSAGATRTNKRAFTDEQEQRIAADYVNGWGMNDLAEHHHVSTFTIRNALRRQGITPRRRGPRGPRKNTTTTTTTGDTRA